MIEFYKGKTPEHRPSYPIYAKYTQYRTILREDFKKRCAYCCDLDNYRISHFAIDHFVPRHPDGCVSNIPDNHYENLIYSCSYCNRAKWNKWPTLDITRENDGVIGFLKPTNKDYKDLFIRTQSGKIVPKANKPLAKYIWDELHLWFPIHSLMWRIERLMDLELKVRENLKNNYSDELKEIHYEITMEITEVFREIFSHN